MRLWLLIGIATLTLSGGLAPGAAARDAHEAVVPSAIGNRANGKDYQPTPAQVVPRETTAGITPSSARQRATNDDLARMDKELLRDEGLNPKTVPKMTNGQ